MAWEITPVSLSEIKRQKSGPRYDFIEHSIREGNAYRLGSDGYFIVAPERSLMPRFVIELVLPETAKIPEYQKLTFDLVERSSGMLWFDSSDYDAYDFAWRMRLGLRAGSPLFEWDGTKNGHLPTREGYIVDLAGSSDMKFATELLMSFPQHRGGKASGDIIDFHLSQKQLYVLKTDGHLVGAAIAEDQPNSYASLTLAIRKEYRNKGLGTWFAGQIGQRLSEQGKTLLVGMSSDVPESMRAVLKLPMRLVKQSFITTIGSL